jgi:hypothetical protein
MKETSLKKYGSEYYFSSSSFKDKMQEKYGVDNPIQSEEVQNKLKEINQEKYGVDYAFSSKEVQEKIKQIKQEKYRILRDKRIQEKVEQDELKRMEKESALRKRREFFENNSASEVSNSIYEFLNQYDTEKHKIAVDFVALLHDSFGISSIEEHDTASFEKQERSNHLKKTQLCEEQGIQLFHIFEDEWMDQNKQEIWKSMLLNALGASKKLYA